MTKKSKTKERALRPQMMEFETSLIEDCLERNEGNVRAAAKELVLPERSMWNRLNRLDIDPAGFR